MIFLPHKKTPELIQFEHLIPRLMMACPLYHDLNRRLGQLTAGYIGEISLDYYLNLIDLPLVGILHGIRLRATHNFFQIDTLLLFPNFILIIEVKHMKGNVTINSVTQQMLRELDGRIEVYDHPITQANFQKQHLRNLLLSLDIDFPPIHTVAVFTHKERCFIKS